ncbi:hypothetical protein NQ315_013233 [Exocentrus adspersus]|uniref:C2H2-type domain-containing protein n=1 Tax=Exocentrus adspersus TaxID=1586481 RepID=A0AAV8V7E7_9CUCU|nr:hypothetical protein NQ315_013233 [Exocentrus adspersus]
MCLLKMKCRTCLETFNMDCMSSLQNKLSIGMSIQELLLLIVPGMIMSKSVKDFICGDCMKVIQGFIKFIQKLITVEKHLRAKAASVTQSLEQDITLKSSVRDFNVTPINNASVNSDGSGKSDEPHSLTNSDEANKTDKPPGNIPEDDSSVNSDDSDKITEPLESIKELEDTTKEKVADTINPTTVENHLTSNESDVTETLGQETVSDSDVCLNETPIDTIYVSSDEEPEKTIKQKSVDFVHTILKDFQNKQRHCNYIDLKTPEKDNSNLEMKKSIPLGKAAHFNQPARTYSRKNQNQMVNSEESFSKEQSLQLTEDCNESLALTTKLLQSKDGDGVTSDNIEEHRPPTLLSVKNKSAGTNDSYITTVVPSMVSADSVISHNRAISITTTNRVIELLLKSFFRSKYNLSWQTPSENKRIIFLGNKLLNLNCHICKTSFSSQDSVTVHFQQEHPNETYPGSDDEFQPDELIEYIPEKKSCHNCPVCSEPFRTIRLLNSHINRNHKDYYRFLCEKCGHKFKKKFNYKLHLQKYERYQCCNVKKCHVCREVLSADAVMEHYETHKTLQCFLCKKKFLSENNFNKHLLLHQNQLDNPKPKKNIAEGITLSDMWETVK